MKQFISALCLVIFTSCNPQDKPASKDEMKFDPFPLEVLEQNSLMARWEKKTVLEVRLIDDMEKDAGWEVTGIGKMSYTEERAKDGKRSLRFSTSLRDEEFYRKNRSKWNSFEAGQGGYSSVVLQFSRPQDWSAFNRLSFWVFVHPTSMPTYSFNISIANEGSVQGATTSRRDDFIQDLKPGAWNHVLFEFPHLDRNKVTKFTINQILRGHNPEEEGIVTYDIDRIEIQKVDADQYEGWTISPGKFAFSQTGYRPSDKKTAVVGSDSVIDFQLLNLNDSAVFTGTAERRETKNGVFRILDFSDFTSEGIYRIKAGNLISNPFPVNKTVWLQPIFKAIDFYYCERCGYDVPGIHRECHKDWQGFRGDVKKIINGGWHDAGDLSQGYWRTAMAVYAMLNNLEAIEAEGNATELAARIRTEITWGLDWLLKVRFGDGFHMSWSTMRIYTDNMVGTIDDVISPAQNVPWENFLAAAVLSRCSQIFKKSDPGMAEKARIAATEDWDAAVASRTIWDQADYREASWGATSSVLLNRMTGDEKYMKMALLLGDLLVKCQEQRFLESIPITGYFYTSSAKEKVIHNYHAAFEEAPLIALGQLCQAYPESEKWIEWYSAAVLYSEFFMKRGSLIAAPFYLLPNSVWNYQEILAEKDEQVRKDLIRQFNDGTHLNDEYVLRTFPIYYNDLFHGNTNINLSSAWALAEASKLRRDAEGIDLAGKQMQWVMGNNPFGQSLMYGSGYDFAPQFAYCLKDIVGSLPVGMDCMSGDKPFWSGTNTATYKEIWIEPVSRFLGTASIYVFYDGEGLNGIRKRPGLKIDTKTKVIPTGEVNVEITVSGKGNHELSFRTFNSKADPDILKIRLSGNKPVTVNVRLTVADPNKPFVAVIYPDKDPDLRKEVIGSLADNP